MMLSRSHPHHAATLGLFCYSPLFVLWLPSVLHSRGEHMALYLFNSLFIYGTDIINNIPVNSAKRDVT